MKASFCYAFTNERIEKIDQTLSNHSIILFKIETSSLHGLEHNQELFKTEGFAHRTKYMLKLEGGFRDNTSDNNILYMGRLVVYGNLV